MSLTAIVSSPCPGTQTLNQATPNVYQGISGSFDYVVLAADPTYGWLLTVYDYSSPSAPCYPNTAFGQVIPDTSDPTGDYGKVVNGSPDPSAGAATVV
jgi:hypothetical protein